MKLKNSVKIFLHVLLWCIVLIVPFYIMSRSSEMDLRHYYGFLVKVSILAILFYVNYLYLIDKFLFKRKLVAYILLNVGLIALLIGIQTFMMDMVMTPPPAPSINRLHDENRGPRPPFYMKILFDNLLIILIVGMSVALKATLRWYRDSMNYEMMKNAHLEADLKNLRNQLNPHFLFNTLNNIYSLIVVDSNKAQESVHRLSNLLRYVMYDDNQKFVPLEKELDFTRNYIDLMKLRLRTNIKLNVTIEGNTSNDLIAPLMFITLIENAFKHGMNNSENCFINIQILVENGKGVLCTVENSLGSEFSQNVEALNSGIGLPNLSKRLELLYPNKYEFTTDRRKDSFFALLRIDFN